MKKNITITLLACFALLAFTSCNNLRHSPKSYYVYEKKMETVDGKTAFIVSFGRARGIWYELTCNSNNEHPEKQDHFPKIHVVVSADKYDLLRPESYYTKSQLKSIGIDMAVLEKDTSFNQIPSFYVLDIREDVTDKGSRFLAILVRQKSKGDSFALDNERIKVEISQPTYKFLLSFNPFQSYRSYSYLELKSRGITLPVEKEEK